MRTSLYVQRTQELSMTGVKRICLYISTFNKVLWLKASIIECSSPGSPTTIGKKRSGWSRRPWKDLTLSSLTPTLDSC